MTIDMHKLMIEIDEEVRAKRASGELPADLERELDMVFARFAPAGAVDGDFDQLLARMEQQSFVDFIAPNESVRKGVPQVKRVVQKSIRWYVRYVIEQYSGFAHTSTKALRKIADRLSAVEQLTVDADEINAIERAPRTQVFDQAIVELMKSANGRVLHARAGSADLVRKLTTEGCDAYGLDPEPPVTASDLDLRNDDERNHLRSLAPGALSGLVLSGSVDILPAGAQLELVDLAAVALSSGAPVVIVSATPESWMRTEGPVVTDLASGKPLHAETWQHILVERGFSVESIEYTAQTQQLNHLPGGEESVAAMNANLDILNHLLFPPSHYMVVARR